MARNFSLIGKVLLTTSLALFAGSVLSQTYPTQPIKLVVPFSPGGGTDTFARVVSGGMQSSLEQNIIVENKPGAGGNIGADLVAKSKPDGYTLLLAQDSLAIVPWLYKGLTFDPIKDFEPIGVGVFMPMALVVKTQLPVDSVKQLIDYSKANPNKLSYGTPGVGTAHHLNFESFLQTTGTKMLHVPYKGASNMLADLASGNVDVAFSALSSVKTLVDSGKLKIIAVADTKRSPQFSNVPTIAETVPNYTASVWFGLMAPKGTPVPVTEKLSQEMTKALSSPEINKQLSDLGYRVQPTDAEGMKKIMDVEYSKWGTLIHAVGIKPNE
jgi:tripartite-type tricarboxylate transporter receptor subunit TctC